MALPVIDGNSLVHPARAASVAGVPPDLEKGSRRAKVDTLSIVDVIPAVIDALSICHSLSFDHKLHVNKIVAGIQNRHADVVHVATDINCFVFPAGTACTAGPSVFLEKSTFPAEVDTFLAVDKLITKTLV